MNSFSEKFLSNCSFGLLWVASSERLNNKDSLLKTRRESNGLKEIIACALQNGYFEIEKAQGEQLCRSTAKWLTGKAAHLFSKSSPYSGLPLFSCAENWGDLRRFKEIWGGITNIFEEIYQNLAQNLRSIEEISHMCVLVNLTFTDVMSRNITACSRRNTTLTVDRL